MCSKQFLRGRRKLISMRMPSRVSLIPILNKIQTANVTNESLRYQFWVRFRTTYANRYTENRNYEFGCLDENECNEGTANCDQNAICVNEIGSFRCACRPGYTGNGYQCIGTETIFGRLDKILVKKFNYLILI